MKTVPGFEIVPKVIYGHKGYSVVVGKMMDKPDLMHYLVVNNDTLVVELSSSRLTEARIYCACLAEELGVQDEGIRSGGFLAEVEHNLSEKNDNTKSWN